MQKALESENSLILQNGSQLTEVGLWVNSPNFLSFRHSWTEPTHFYKARINVKIRHNFPKMQFET